MSSFRTFSYMQLGNIELIEKIHAQFLKDPESVEPSWRYFFEGMEFGRYSQVPAAVADDLRIFNLIDAYRRFGHLQAKTNPISLNPSPAAPELSLAALNFEEKELEKNFPTCGLLQEPEAPLSQIIAVLQAIYCGTKAIEYMDFHSRALQKWIQERIEPSRFSPNFSIEEKKRILQGLNRAELFEIFLHTKYVGQKRFSLEGGETLIPILKQIIEGGAELGMDEFAIGMAHRGRLNVLANILNMSFSMIFGEFEDFVDPDLIEGSGDVKYHKGFSSNIKTSQGLPVHISLTANPSHLESVDPIVEGKVKAKQIQRSDRERKKIVPILIHGDASLAGQGVVYETLQLSQLEGYTTGGTLHIVVNNQIGFTTLPAEYCSSRYCTDVATGFGFPVLHVNAEDPEGCVYAAKLALEIRQKFGCDVFIELNCYRKFGHNEGDEPAFTQPLEYKMIREKRPIREIYRDTLVKEGVLEKEMVLKEEEEFKKALHFELEELKLKKEAFSTEAFSGVWHEYKKGNNHELFEPVTTAVDISTLKEISKGLSQIPQGLEIQGKLVRLIEERSKMGSGQRPLDWAMAETLAFGSLLWEDVHVRLSGQDCRRGTFTQRHAVWVDQKTGDKYFPLAHLKEGQGVFNVYNSSLSEFGVLGFEYGYSLAYPSALVLWEAQFGDFANGGQVIFDQYLASGAQKWQRYSGLVVLLPHGYEGQGPEHSSARLERFLQLAAEGNLQVVYPTTPAQYFHLLRRQVKRQIRVPLVVMTPKGLLRHPACVSSLEDLSMGRFQEILDDPSENSHEATRVLFCCGRVYYDLLEEREKRKLNSIALIRIEQLYPLHHDAFMQILKKYARLKEYFWVQEEPRNMGAFGYIQPLLKELLPKDAVLNYVGRSMNAATATGSHKIHEKEHELMMNRAFST